METTITAKFLKKIHDRVEQVFIAKTGHKPDHIKLMDDRFWAQKTFYLSYGAKEVVGEYIYSYELDANLDEIIRDRKLKEESKREKESIENEERHKRFEEIKKQQRRQEYEKLKKEFE